MIVDNKGKLFGKISIIDLIIVLAVAALVVFAGIKILAPKGEDAPVDTVTVYVEFTQDCAPKVAAEAIKAGDPCLNVSYMSNMGTVTSVELAPSLTYNVNAEGQFVAASRDDCAKVTVRVEGAGSIDTNGSVKIDTWNYYLGKEYELRCGNATMYGIVTALGVKEN